jgi:hypothetical protein
MVKQLNIVLDYGRPTIAIYNFVQDLAFTLQSVKLMAVREADRSQRTYLELEKKLLDAGTHRVNARRLAAMSEEEWDREKHVRVHRSSFPLVERLRYQFRIKEVCRVQKLIFEAVDFMSPVNLQSSIRLVGNQLIQNFMGTIKSTDNIRLLTLNDVHDWMRIYGLVAGLVSSNHAFFRDMATTLRISGPDSFGNMFQDKTYLIGKVYAAIKITFVMLDDQWTEWHQNLSAEVEALNESTRHTFRWEPRVMSWRYKFFRRYCLVGDIAHQIVNVTFAIPELKSGFTHRNVQPDAIAPVQSADVDDKEIHAVAAMADLLNLADDMSPEDVLISETSSELDVALDEHLNEVEATPKKDDQGPVCYSLNMFRKHQQFEYTEVDVFRVHVRVNWHTMDTLCKLSGAVKGGPNVHWRDFIDVVYALNGTVHFAGGSEHTFLLPIEGARPTRIDMPHPGVRLEKSRFYKIQRLLFKQYGVEIDAFQPMIQ